MDLSSMENLIKELTIVQQEIEEDSKVNGDETIHKEWSDKLKEIIDVLIFIGD